MRKQLMKGNEAIVKSAILAGCRAFYGYPITPASEIAEAAAEFMPQDRRRIRAGGERGGGHQHAVRRGVGGRARHDRVQRSRHQPDAGRHQLHGRRGAALRHRRHYARRAGAGQHWRRAGRLSPGGEGRRPRQLSHHRAGSALRAGDGGFDRAGLRAGRPLSQPGGDAGRRFYRPDDGAGGVSADRHRAAPARVGRGRNRGVARQPHHVVASGLRRTGKAHSRARSQVQGRRAARGARRGVA